jgi:hypothetical protein
MAPLPDQATRAYAVLVKRLTPAGRAWVPTVSQELRDGTIGIPALLAYAHGSCAEAYSGCAHADIDALCFIIMMAAAQDAADDLKDMLADMKAASGRKARLRKLHETMDKAALDAEVAKIKNDLDSMSEMGEIESLRLQMAMERASKMMSTLSDIMKKISDTAESIAPNLK